MSETETAPVLPHPDAAAGQATKVAQLKTRSPKLNNSAFALSEHAFNQYSAKPEAGVSMEDILEPSYWAHVAVKLKPLDIIHVNAMDGSYYALLQVRSASRIEAVCEVLMHREFKPLTRLAQSEGKEYFARFSSPAAGWQVLRASDKQVIKEGFDNERAALQWLDGHLKALAA